MSEIWGPSQILSIQVGNKFLEPSIQFIPDPNFGRYMIALGGRSGSDYILASSLKQESLDTYVGPIHAKDAFMKLRVKMGFLQEFRVTFFNYTSYRYQ